MDLTLIEQSKLALGRDETLKAVTMEILAKYSDLLQYLPFRNVTVTYDEDNKKTLVDDMENETIVIGGGDLDVDSTLVSKGRYKRGKHEIYLIKHLSGFTTKMLIKGDAEYDYREINGLQSRCAGEQQLNNNGDILQISNLDMLIASVDNPTHLLVDNQIRRRLSQWREEIDYEFDHFGRRITTYKNLPILIAGQDEMGEEILPFTEPDPSGVLQCTSIYCLSLAEDGLVGLQVGPMEVRDLGELDTKPVYRTRIEWYIGLTTIRQKSIARLRYINDGVISV